MRRLWNNGKLYKKLFDMNCSPLLMLEHHNEPLTLKHDTKVSQNTIVQIFSACVCVDSRIFAFGNMFFIRGIDICPI